MSKEYFIEITIMDTQGKQFEEWEHVVSTVEILEENFRQADVNKVASQIQRAIRDYEEGKK